MKNIAGDKRIYHPLTHAQKRIYYDEIKFPGTGWAIIGYIVRYKEELDFNLLTKAINNVVLRNEGLCLRIVEIEHEIFQYPSPYKEISVDFIDFSGPGSEQRLQEWIHMNSQKTFELIDHDLYYFSCIKFNDEEYGYYMKTHHLVSDGWTCALLITEIHEIYSSLKAGKRIDDEPNPSYLRYISDEQDYLNSVQAENDKEFWHEKMLPLPNAIDLSVKAGNPYNIKADALVLPFPRELCQKMNLFRVIYKTSLYKLLFSALSIYIAKVTGTNDTIIGGVNHNRTTDLQKKMAGMFVSTIPFRIKVDGDMSFDSLLEKIGNDINSILKNHQKYPFDLLATELRKISSKDTGSLLNIFMVGHSEAKGDNFLYRYIFPGCMTNALTIHFGISGTVYDMLELEYNYQVEKFSQTDIQRIHNGLINILKNAFIEPGKKILEIDLMSDEEKRQVLYEFNNTETKFPEGKTLYKCFEAQVEKTPANTALVYMEDRLTYKELNEKANQLARVLRKKGVKPNHILGIKLERSLEMIVGIMAVLKAGGSYLPLDTGCPPSIASQLLKESESRLLLTREIYAKDIDFDGEVIHLQEGAIYLGDGQNSQNLKIKNSPKDLAYIIYSSIYTGIPLGVMIEHAAIINKLFTLQKKYPLRESDVSLLKTSFRSDVGVAESLGWFWGGGSLYILGEDKEKDLETILEVIHKQRVTQINFTPTMFNQLVNLLKVNSQKKSRLSHLEYIFLSGEPIPPEMINKYRRLQLNAAVENFYSITEASVYTSAYSLSVWNGTGTIPIGKPMDNMKIYILNFINEEPVLLPIGIPGELCISGLGLARGYLKKEELTDKKFIDSPFTKGERLYRTGDLARWLPDGNIEFLGRIDRQVEIKGSRIERQDIESLLLKQEEIKEAVVVAIEVDEEKYLYAYIVAENKLDTSIIRERLAQDLPIHFIPAYFIQIDEIPLTAEGKANRGELLDLKQAPHHIEKILAEIEAEVLHLNKEDIDIDDNFFRLGGHSAKAAQVASRINEAFNVKISMSEIFKRPTLRQLSQYLIEAAEVKYASIQPAAPKEYYPQSSAQKRIYFLHQLDEESTTYNIQMMDIYCKGFEKDNLENAFKALIKRHESLRTSFHLLDGEALQKIHDYEEVGADFEIEYYEAAEDGKICSWEPGKDSRCEQMEGKEFEDVIKSFVKTFDLSKPPLLRVGFIKILNNTKILLLDMHHIIADGISVGILAKELWELYDGEELPGLRLQYKDFSEWLNGKNQIQAVKEQEDFWMKEFSGEIPLINLPIDSPRPAKLTFDGDILQFEIGKQETKQLKKIARDYSETLYMVMFSIYNILLAKLCGQEDIVVGNVTSGRGHDDLKNIVGMFFNTLALRNYPRGEMTFEKFLSDVKINTFAAFDNQDYPYEELVSKVAPRVDAGRNPLFDVVFGLEYETDPTSYLMEVAIPDRSKPYEFRTKNAKFDLTLICVEAIDAMECLFEYKTRLFKPETIQRLVSYFKELIASVCSGIKQKIADLDILPEKEKKKILEQFSGTSVDYPADKTIHEIVAEHAKKNPQNPAIIFKDQSLTYRELDEKTNRLALLLREKGLQPNSIVTLMTGRTMELIIAQLGILKAGGAYLSIDTQLPAERKKFLLEDSNTNFLLVRKDIIDEEKEALTALFSRYIIPIDDETIYSHIGDWSQVENVVTPDDLAYVIYTSGTTGKPKGVMMHHRGIVSLNVCTRERFELDITSHVLQFATVSFDASVWEVWMALMNGGALVLVDTDTIRNYDRFVEYMNETGVTITLLPPIYVNHIDPPSLKTLKTLLTGGAAAGSEMVEKWRKHLRYVNCYGPTEASICCTMWKASMTGEPVFNPPIGLPVDNTTIHIIDKNMNLVPIGIAGELCVSGFHVARGYLNRPELTQEKFVEDPIIKGNRMYRTGDLVRWMPDGNIEFSGRIDFQVKIRGFRIEPGEVENSIARHKVIKDAAVLVLDNKVTGEKFLCAYFVPQVEITINELRDYLHEKLPDYMVPSHFVQVDKIPLTPSGKVDKDALPKPQLKTTGRKYKAPRNEIEKHLAEAWQQVLGIEQIGIDDDFFTMGGDSIKAIRIISRLQKNKLKLEVNQLFLHKTIEELSTYVKPLEKTKVTDQGLVKGYVQLTPIQRWFFENRLPYGAHFNQSVTLYRKEGFDEKVIKEVFTKIVQHHDALRMVYEFKENTVVQKNRGIDGKLFHLELIPLEKEKDENAAIQRESLRIQSSIDWQNGPLVKVGLFKGANSDGDHLLIAVHHLVVDGISWRILLEDFETAYQQLTQEKEVTLQGKTDSFKQWAQKLLEYAGSKELLKQLPYWKRVEETKVKSLPVDHEIDKENRLFKYNTTISLELTGEKTGQLLTGVNQAYNTEINDILLTALGLAVKQWTGLDKVLINLEGHGREKIIEDVDITRTVGWFTSQYPLILDLKKTDDLAFSIKNVKETIRRIPSKGIGHGILKYLTPAEKKESIQFKQVPEIAFNYREKFEPGSNEFIDQVSGIPGHCAGENIAPDYRTDYKINIECEVSEREGELTLYFSYNKKEYDGKSIERLTELFKDRLEMIIEHCMVKKQRELTPSDFGYPQMSIYELDRLSSEIKHNIGNDMEILQIYPLSPMQGGMLYHTLKDKNSRAYFNQFSLKLRGEVEVLILEESLNRIIDRHDTFRTVFAYEGLSEPVQVVLTERKISLFYEDISHLAETGQVKHLNQFKKKDRGKGFDLTRDNLNKFDLFKMGENSYYLLWTTHHILMDGWCMGIIIKELTAIYRGLKKGTAVQLNAAIPYRHYIDWLENQEKEEGLAYWREYLQTYEEAVAVPGKLLLSREDEYKYEEYSFVISEELLPGINRLSNQYHVTINTIFQALWGILLQRYNNKDDVVFGAVVSGRPPEINGIEEIVGLFVNMMPVRVQVKKGWSFFQLLKVLQQHSLESKKYEYLPIVEVQSQTAMKGDLIDHLLAFENFPLQESEEIEEGAADFAVVGFEGEGQTNYNFDITIIPGKDYRLIFTYNALVYDSDILKSIPNHLENILWQVVKNPGINIDEIEIITEAEKNKLLYEFNDTKAGYPQDKTIQEILEAQTYKTPGNIALVFNDQQLTYQGLNEKTNRLAKVLRQKQVKPDQFVGLLVERSLEMMIGIFAILKAGGAYLPIDPDYPSHRIHFMLADISSQLLLSQEKIMAAADYAIEIIDIGDELLYQGDGHNLPLVNTPKDLAYAIYTSGSTGKPKGVLIQHQSLINMAYSQELFYPIDETDKVLQFSTISFDASAEQIYIALFSGATLVLVDKMTLLDMNRFERFMDDRQLTHIDSVPLFINTIPLRRYNSLRRIVAGGDVCPLSLVQKWTPYCDFVNTYGPTETTVTSNRLLFKKGEEPQGMSIGKAVDNTCLYVLDKNMGPVPIGIAGELYIGGDGVARGYLNRPELNAEKFIRIVISHSSFVIGSSKTSLKTNNQCPMSNDHSHPHHSTTHHSPLTIYRTGDLVRWLPGGDIDFLGRIDSQVKIRGFRIELGEIEDQLKKIDYIKEAAVIAREDIRGQKYLCAYFIPGKGAEINLESLKMILSKNLPDYMIPSHFVRLDTFPLTTSGKLDRKALPEPGKEGISRKYTAPTNEIEEILAGIWGEVLGMDKVGIDDNFFTMGGDSIKTILVSARLQKHRLKININDLFSYQTIRELAKQIEPVGKPGKEPGKKPISITRDEDSLSGKIQQDYQVYLQQVQEEKWPDLSAKREFRHIFLTGSTGYLGAHLLFELLNNTTATLYLPVRGETSEEAGKRLKKKIIFYFGEDFFTSHKGRIVMIRADLRSDQLGIDDQQYQSMCDTVECVVHPAARVKHFGDYEEFYKDNVEAAVRLLEFAFTGNKKDFHFISTIDTGSGDIPGREYLVFTEYCHDMGQQSQNVYIKSKFEAEKQVLAYREKGLNTFIHRAANMTFHSDTGQFQENIDDNLFYSMLKVFIKVGFWSEKMSQMEFDLSFINQTAHAMVKLVTTKFLKNETYHLCSPHTLNWEDMALLLKKVGIEVPRVNPEKAGDYLAKFTGNPEYEKMIERLKLYSWAWEEKPATLTVPKVDRTVMLLKKLGFQWPKVTRQHIRKMIDYCRKVGFI